MIRFPETLTGLDAPESNLYTDKGWGSGVFGEPAGFALKMVLPSIDASAVVVGSHANAEFAGVHNTVVRDPVVAGSARHC